ncbi:DUF2835 domain-containing protein [Shewanella submarina]|uniref:DUF2835 domain-containing protein n=1 Tax=Shewanella submarina TaxID=2016376 RepID=A0ABV7GDN5_9GAMM|nr:DUF2835 domain-containing protein [Shewanella submarina]MCL1037517.1 DUF2835 domain-containing protein [Shewanella submarina]
MEFIFSLNLTYREFMPYYRGDVDKVEVQDRRGTRLWINCRHFRRFLTPSGIHGWFRLVLNEKGDVVSLELI